MLDSIDGDPHEVRSHETSIYQSLLRGLILLDRSTPFVPSTAKPSALNFFAVK